MNTTSYSDAIFQNESSTSSSECRSKQRFVPKRLNFVNHPIFDSAEWKAAILPIPLRLAKVGFQWCWNCFFFERKSKNRFNITTGTSNQARGDSNFVKWIEIAHLFVFFWYVWKAPVTNCRNPRYTHSLMKVVNDGNICTRWVTTTDKNSNRASFLFFLLTSPNSFKTDFFICGWWQCPLRIFFWKSVLC